MIARVLKPDEWATAPQEMGALLAKLRPEDVEVLVIESGGRIVACNAVIRTVALEGVWIAPEFRGNAGVGRRLIRATRAAAIRMGGAWISAGAATSCMRDILRRLGAAPFNADTFVFALEKE